MSLDYRQFVQAVGDSGLMSHEELRVFRESLPRRQRIATVQALSEALVRNKKLTPYQAERIARGEHEGLVLGNYIVIGQIGRGGMGEVFKARHRFMKRTVAMKVLPESAVESPAAVRRFQREMEASARLVHPNIVTAYDAAYANGRYCLVMEYIEGVDLATLLREQGPLPVAVVNGCLIQAARGLAHAHSLGVVHRDIKPTNLLLSRKGQVKILDMGLVRLSAAGLEGEAGADLDHDDAAVLNVDSQIVGTVDYMSPEQAEDSSQADARSDIYALGCTMFRLLTGRTPYEADTPMKLLLAHQQAPVPSLRDARDDVPPALDLVFRRMMAKRPSDRQPSMEQLITHLENCGPVANERELAAFLAGGKAPITQASSEGEPASPTPNSEFDVPASPGEGPRRGDKGFPAAPSNTGVTLAPPPSPPAVGDQETRGQTTEPTPTPLEASPPAITQDRALGPAVGIDLGTTFSAIAWLDESGRPQTLLNAEGEKATPSVVLLDGDEVVVGREAVKAMPDEMESIAACVKRDMGQRLFHKPVAGRPFPPEALQACILARLRRDAELQIGRFSQAVITVPAYFDEVRRKATQDAAYIAGFESVDIVNEPTAAAIAYGFRQGLLREGAPHELQRILVYDLGGGTFDVTVMEVAGQDFTMLATDGDVHLGGRDFDERLIDHVAEQFLSQHAADPRLSPNAFGRLWRECEEAKRTLSMRSRAFVDCRHAGQSLRVEVSRDFFQSITADLLDRTRHTTRQTLQTIGLEWSDIDRVLLVGGSTRMPAVADMLRRLSGKEPDRSISPDDAVAHGAALHAGLLLTRAAGRRPSFRLRNVNSHSLGIVATEKATKLSRNAVVIPRNTPLPVAAKRVFRTRRKGQKTVLVKIVEGESGSPDSCAQVGECRVSGLPRGLPAGTQVEVRFRYEENGRLGVSVRVEGSDAEVHHELHRQNLLTQEQLDRWRAFVLETSD